MQLRQIDMRPANVDAHVGEVIKRTARQAADAARGVVEHAQYEAALLLEDARRRAEDTLREHQATLEQHFWKQAAAYAASVDGEWERSLRDLESRLAVLVGDALRRLLHQAPLDAQLHACIKHLMAQAGRPDSGVLFVSDDDYATVLSLSADLPWPVERDADLPVGKVKLVSNHGRWECDIDGSLRGLMKALGLQLNSLTENNDAGI